MVPLKYDAGDFVFRAFIYFVDQRDLSRLLVKRRFNLRVEVAFLLKKVDQVLLAFPHQVAVDAAFRLDGN